MASATITIIFISTPCSLPFNHLITEKKRIQNIWLVRSYTIPEPDWAGLLAGHSWPWLDAGYHCASVIRILLCWVQSISQLITLCKRDLQWQLQLCAYQLQQNPHERPNRTACWQCVVPYLPTVWLASCLIRLNCFFILCFSALSPRGRATPHISLMV